MKRYVVVALVVGLLVAADKSKDARIKKEKKQLQGLWRVVDNGDRLVPSIEDGVPVFRLTKDKFLFYLLKEEGGKVVEVKGSREELTYSIDPTVLC
jgi:hypothetical protein